MHLRLRSADHDDVSHEVCGSYKVAHHPADLTHIPTTLQAAPRAERQRLLAQSLIQLRKDGRITLEAAAALP